jgi:galactose mutarotase-like enzyme
MDNRKSRGIRHTLISTRGEETFSQGRLSSRELPGSSPVSWFLDVERLQGGKQDGVELITLDNGRLRMRVIPTRGMGILDVEMGDLRLGWDSPVRQVVHPRHINLESRGGLGWLEGFNEWLVRCGLEWAGAPGTDRFVNNMGDAAEMNLTLHGKIANIPASDVRFDAEQEAPYRLRLTGTVEEKMLFGPNLELISEIETEAGSSQVLLTDKVTNRSAQPQEFQLIYHINIGTPLLGEGTRFYGAVSQVNPINARAVEGVTAYDRFQGPQAGFIEQVYCLRPLAGPHGEAAIMLSSPSGDRGLLLRYPVEQLPYFSLWKNLAAEEDGYVTGLEPATGFPLNRSLERKAGRVPVLAPGESREFSLRFDLLAGQQEVADAIDTVAGVQGGREVEICDKILDS